MKFTPTRPTFPDDATDAEQAIVGEHFRALQKRHEAGKLVLAGRTEAAEMGIGVFLADSLEEAQEFIANDPCVLHKIFHAEVFPFRLAIP